MNKRDTNRLLRHLARELSGADASALEAELARDEELRRVFDRLQAAQRGLAGSGYASRFADGFAQRVMARVDEEAAVSQGLIDIEALMRTFSRVAPAALAASAILGAYTLLGGGSAQDRSTVEVLLGLPAVTLDAAYTLDVMPWASGDGGTS